MALWLGVSLSTGAAASVPTAAAPDDPELRIFQVDSLPQLDQPDAAYAEYVNAVRTALRGRAHAAANRLAQRALVLWPKRQRPWLHLAAAEHGARRWGAAITAARRARAAQADALTPATVPTETAAAADYWEGVCLYETQRYDEALPRLEAAARQAPDWAEAHRALGEAAFVTADGEAALRSYARAFQLDAEVGGVRDMSYYADAHAAQGDVERGIAAFEAALERFPYEAGLHARLGSLYRQEGNLTEAYYHFTLEPLLHGTNGEFASPALQATSDILKEIEGQSDHPSEKELRSVVAGLASLRNGEALEAVHAFDHLTRISGTGTVVPQLLLADALLAVDQPRAARHVLQSALTVQPDFVPALVLLGRVHRVLGNDDQAGEVIERAEKLFPTYWKLQADSRR